MKLIISESQYKELVLTGASKRDILVQKLGLSEINAETISRLCGPLSVWITNKIIELYRFFLKNNCMCTKLYSYAA